MKRFAMVLALALIAAACGGSDSEPTTTDAGGTDTTTTSTTAAASTTTSAQSETTTTTGADSGSAEFVISRVVFGDDGYVSITNVGASAGSLDGWQLCQRPAYFAIGSVEVAPGETVHFTMGSVEGLSGQVIESNGRFGRLSDSSGEMGLYADASFGSASSIRSYVEWGSSGHGRSSVAVAAGIWTEGGFVPVDAVPGLAAISDVPISPADWATS
jgi:hypothetical protein